jgi:hypothetical protein
MNVDKKPFFEQYKLYVEMMDRTSGRRAAQFSLPSLATFVSLVLYHCCFDFIHPYRSPIATQALFPASFAFNARRVKVLQCIPLGFGHMGWVMKMSRLRPRHCRISVLTTEPTVP